MLFLHGNAVLLQARHQHQSHVSHFLLNLLIGMKPEYPSSITAKTFFSCNPCQSLHFFFFKLEDASGNYQVHSECLLNLYESTDLPLKSPIYSTISTRF